MYVFFSFKAGNFSVEVFTSGVTGSEASEGQDAVVLTVTIGVVGCLMEVSREFSEVVVDGAGVVEFFLGFVHLVGVDVETDLRRLGWR